MEKMTFTEWRDRFLNETGFPPTEKEVWEAAQAAERERPRQVVAYMATNREGEVRFTDNPSAARELEGYGWAITPLADAGPNAEVTGLCRQQEQR